MPYSTLPWAAVKLPARLRHAVVSQLVAADRGQRTEECPLPRGHILVIRATKCVDIVNTVAVLQKPLGKFKKKNCKT